MQMPEASVYQNDFSKPRENQVRCAGQVAAMQPESITKPVRGTAHGQLRLCVGLANAPHVGATLGWGKGVGHGVGHVS